jgi:hypothetical protein
MDISEIRRENIKEIIKQRCGGVKAQFARTIKREPQVVSRWWASNPEYRRNVGHNLARDIEVKFNLKSGWLDIIHNENSDLEENFYRKQKLRFSSGLIREIPLKWTALLEQQQLRLTLLQEVKGQIMLLSTDKDAWSIQLIGTHPHLILSQGWGLVIEPNTPLMPNEYCMIKRNNGEILLRVMSYQDQDKSIVTNPISGDQISLVWDDIDTAHYCYIGIPPSKINPS